MGLAFRIASPTDAGIFYGGRTLLQLLRQPTPIPRGTGTDWPRYPVRGLMLDLGRTAWTRDFVEAQIKRGALLKLNVMHLHLTDDQRWGIQSDTHPEIVSTDALTKADIAHILETARRQHVMVIPEVDLPGHSQTLLSHHPDLELKVGGVSQSPDGRAYVYDKLDITNPKAVALARELISEYLPLFPGPFWHLGADEYMSPAQYPLYPDLSAYAIRTYGPGATPADAVHAFINEIDDLVRRSGKTLVVWNDQLGGTGLVPVNADVRVEWWTDASPVGDTVTTTPSDLAQQGFQLVNAGYFPTYYAEDVGPGKGKSNMQQAYETWDITKFCGPELSGDVKTPCFDAPASSIVGSMINEWGPHPDSAADVARGLWSRLAVISQKTWDSPALTPSYAEFRNVVAAATGMAIEE